MGANDRNAGRKSAVGQIGQSRVLRRSAMLISYPGWLGQGRALAASFRPARRALQSRAPGRRFAADHRHEAVGECLIEETDRRSWHWP